MTRKELMWWRGEGWGLFGSSTAAGVPCVARSPSVMAPPPRWDYGSYPCGLEPATRELRYEARLRIDGNHGARQDFTGDAHAIRRRLQFLQRLREVRPQALGWPRFALLRH